MKLSTIPNIITVFRVILIIPFAYFLVLEHYENATIIFFIAGASDGLDGLVAKQFQWQSRFGSITDPLADKLLFFVALLLLAINNQLSWTLFIIETVRDLAIIGAATLYHYKVGPYDMKPSLVSKLNTALLILLVLLILVNLSGWLAISDTILYGLELTVITTCLVSFAHYMWLAKQAFKAHRESSQSTSSASHTQES